MCFVSFVRLVALIGFVRTASLRSRAGEERKPLAIAAAVSDGVQGKPDWHDAFMVFAHAARKAAEKSSHSIDLLAIVPDALSQDDRDTFAGFGFTVLPRPPFVPLKEVENAFGRSEMLKGCCGEAENLKLYASELVDYDRVLVLDGDVMLLRAFDELVDLQNPLLGTYDYELNLPNSAFPPINGGWLLFRPNLADGQALKSIIREGDFRPGSGWKGSQTGWAFGGAGPQGVLSFYYNQVHVGETDFAHTRAEKGAGDVKGLRFTQQPQDSRFTNLDRGVYDVIDTRTLNKAWNDTDSGFDQIQSFHFTGNCGKPWACWATRTAICERATAQWWALRAEVASMHGLEASARCVPGGKYTPMRNPT